MRKIDDRHFGPDSVGKINVLYQNVKRTKSKGSIKGKFVLCFELYMNSFMLLSMNSMLICIHLFMSICFEFIHCIYLFRC
jgi:hypothetical protein